MSTLAKQLIGEDDEELRRLAHAALFPDRERMRKIKAGLEAVGMSNILIRQNSTQWSKIVDLEITADPPPLKARKNSEKGLAWPSIIKKLVVDTIIKAGYKREMNGMHFFKFYHDGSFRASVDMDATGSFQGVLSPEGKLIPYR